MKLYEFTYEDNGILRPHYCLTEDGAKELKKTLDRGGMVYTMASHGTLYDALTNLPEWNDDNFSDGEMLDLIMDIIKGLGV